MKLKDGFITHEMGDQWVMIAEEDANFNGLIRFNKTAGFIVNCLKEETTKEMIVDAMVEKYDAPRNVIEKDAEIIIGKLRSMGVLDEGEMNL